jgi:hypothetical protein
MNLWSELAAVCADVGRRLSGDDDTDWRAASSPAKRSKAPGSGEHMEARQAERRDPDRDDRHGGATG